MPLRRRSLLPAPWQVVLKPVKRSSLEECLRKAGGAAGQPLPASTGTGSKVPRRLPDATGGPQHLRVLVVEDNSTSQQAMRKTISNAGFICDVASQGVEALEAVQRITYHVILMDLFMPVMDGIAATRELRRIEAGK